MTSWLLFAGLTLALVGGFAVVGFESPTRAAGGLLTAVVGCAGALGALGVGLAPGFVLWCGGALALFLLTAVVLVNIDIEERGRRRLRIKPALFVPVLLLLWGALAMPLLGAVPQTPAAPPAAAAVSRAIAEDLALPFTLALVALAVSLVMAIALVRRRS